jgi:hypothetical protein
MTKLSRTFLACAAMSFCASAALAVPSLIASNAPNTVSLTGQQSDTTGSPYSTVFATAAGFDVTRVEWWGYDLLRTAGANAFEVRLNNVLLSGSVGSDPAGSFVLKDSSGTDTDVVKYFIDLAPLQQALTSGLSTNLSIYNSSFDVEWYWQGGTGAASPGVGYRLFGEQGVTLPEPGSLALVALAGLALLGLGRAQRASAP